MPVVGGPKEAFDRIVEILNEAVPHRSISDEEWNLWWDTYFPRKRSEPAHSLARISEVEPDNGE